MMVLPLIQPLPISTCARILFVVPCVSEGERSIGFDGIIINDPA